MENGEDRKKMVKWYWRRWQMSSNFGQISVMAQYWEGNKDGDTFIWQPPWSKCWSIV